MDNLSRRRTMYRVAIRAAHDLSSTRIYTMQTLTDELANMGLHVRPNAVLLQTKQRRRHTSVTSRSHVSAHHQSNLKSLNSRRNPQNVTNPDTHTKQVIISQGNLTKSRRKRAKIVAEVSYGLHLCCPRVANHLHHTGCEQQQNEPAR